MLSIQYLLVWTYPYVIHYTIMHNKYIQFLYIKDRGVHTTMLQGSGSPSSPCFQFCLGDALICLHSGLHHTAPGCAEYQGKARLAPPHPRTPAPQLLVNRRSLLLFLSPFISGDSPGKVLKPPSPAHPALLLAFTDMSPVSCSIDSPVGPLGYRESDPYRDLLVSHFLFQSP